MVNRIELLNGLLATVRETEALVFSEASEDRHRLTRQLAYIEKQARMEFERLKTDETEHDPAQYRGCVRFITESCTALRSAPVHGTELEAWLLVIRETLEGTVAELEQRI